jgi:hypothetical protein
MECGALHLVSLPLSGASVLHLLGDGGDGAHGLVVVLKRDRQRQTETERKQGSHMCCKIRYLWICDGVEKIKFSNVFLICHCVHSEAEETYHFNIEIEGEVG